MIKLVDLIVTIICGEALGLLAGMVLLDYSINSAVLNWIIYLIAPVLAIACLWLADLISRRVAFLFQLAKYVLIGILVVFIDLKIFNALILFFGLDLGLIYGTSKGVSFLISALVKFVGNKLWVFEKKQRDGIGKEFLVFLAVTFGGLLIDVAAFFYFSRIMGPQFGISINIWTNISVILAAIAAAAWNFLGYKFIVFKKDASPIP